MTTERIKNETTTEYRVRFNCERRGRDKDLTHEKVALELDIDRSHYTRMMNGSKPINLRTLHKISEILGVDVQELLAPIYRKEQESE